MCPGSSQVFIEEALQVKKEINRKTEEYLLRIKKPPREYLALQEASHAHLLVTPPSHFMAQKVRGLGWRFFVNEGKYTNRMISTLQILSR
jgi:hypothetical protein